MAAFVSLTRDADAAEERIGAPFDQEQRLASVRRQQAEIEEALMPPASGEEAVSTPTTKATLGELRRWRRRAMRNPYG